MSCFTLIQEQLDFNVIREFHHPSPITHLAWSPLSSDSMPKLCRIATAGSDSKIRIYNSNLAQSEDVMVSISNSIPKIIGFSCGWQYKI